MRPAALRVGAFAMAGLALLALALVTAGGRWWSTTERAVMHFQTSVYGLQVGAPVVLRGVQVGRVTAIGLAPGSASTGTGASSLVLPVTAEFDSTLLRPLLAPGAGADADKGSGLGHAAGRTLPSLVERGLVARLATQSLLTGLLYVDLDLAAPQASPSAGGGPIASRSTPAGTPTAVVEQATAVATTSGLPLIPTAPTRLQTLQTQLEGLDLGQIGRDLAAVAAATRELLAAPQARQALSRTAEAAQSLRQLAQALQREASPLARSAEDTLAQARRSLAAVDPLLREGSSALRQVGQAAAQAGAAASQVGDAAAQARALALAAQPLVADMRRTADELGAAAGTLRDAAAPGSPLRRQTEAALLEVAQAATALRALATLLEQHPSAIIWGRPKAP